MMRERQISVFADYLVSRLSMILLLLLVWTTATAQVPLSVLGYWTCPPRVAVLEQRKKKKKKKGKKRLRTIWRFSGEASFEHMLRTWHVMVMRSFFVLVLWFSSGQLLPPWILYLPLCEWLLASLSVAWPFLAQQPEMELGRLVLAQLRLSLCLLMALGTILLWLLSIEQKSEFLSLIRGCLENFSLAKTDHNSSICWLFSPSHPMLSVGLLCPEPVEGTMRESARQPVKDSIDSDQKAPRVLIQEIDSTYRIDLRGEFHLSVKKESTFWLRMVIIFLRQLEITSSKVTSQIQSKGRPTRDGRRPFLSQQYLAEGFGIKQPQISRWEKYWLDHNWANLLSKKSEHLLTPELRDRIVTTFARFPWWGLKRVREYLAQEGIAVTYQQVRQAAQVSGWQELRKRIGGFFVISQESIRPRDEALVGQLLEQISFLQQKIEAQEPLTSQEELKLADLQSIGAELGIDVPEKMRLTHWGQKIRSFCFGNSTQSANEESVLCPACGSQQVQAKGQKGRTKRYINEDGQWQEVEVYRYRCQNEECNQHDFTHLPEGLLPHSPYSVGTRLQAFYLVAVVGASCRRVGTALGVSSSHVYRWVSAFGRDLLPMAALFGVVHSSGVVGIDEKYVQVPIKGTKSHKKNWMYVYFAVDVYTYDLLHIDIYAQNTSHSTLAFLNALKAKGYRPKVIVTDLRREYSNAIATVFSKARHHECIFHALQWIGTQLFKIYGHDYEKEYTEVAQLKEEIVKIFHTTSKRVAISRYNKVMAQRDLFVGQKEEVAAVFNSLERHWPKLLNAVESTIIPKTNNTVELVIRRFDQLYQNFCGFDSQESARTFLRVFEKAYRFTPFTQGAQPHIRGKCPLELAGYDISQLPMRQICRGWAMGWPPKTSQEVFPNV